MERSSVFCEVYALHGLRTSAATTTLAGLRHGVGKRTISAQTCAQSDLHPHAAIRVSIGVAPSGSRAVENGAVAVEHQLTLALAQWNDTRGLRFLRRQPPQLLAGLDES
jgi:hypothetical protein